MVHPVVVALVGIDGQLPGAQGEGRHLPPLGAQEVPRAPGDEVARLVDERLQRQGLPAVRIHHARVAGEVGGQGRVDGSVVPVAVAIGLVGAVLCPEGQHRGRDAVAQGSRRALGEGRAARVVAEPGHPRVEGGLGLLGAGRVGEARGEDPVGRKADRLGPGPGDVGSAAPLVVQVGPRDAVVGGPGVPHRDGEVEQVASVDRGPGQVAANRPQRLLVPLARDRLGLDRHREGEGDRDQRCSHGLENRLVFH